MAGKREIVIFGPEPPPYGGVAIFDTLLNIGFKKNGINCSRFIDTSLKTIGDIESDSVILDSFFHSLEYPEGRKILKCLILKSARKLKWIKIIHNGSLPDRYKDYRLKLRILFSASMGLFDEIIVVSEFLKEWLVNTIGVTKQIHVISSLLPIPEDYGIEPGTREEGVKTISAIGVFTKLYGFADLVAAIEKIQQLNKTTLKLILIDGGVTHDPSYEAKILKGRDWIEVKRQLSHPETLSILKSSDVFVRPSYYESFGLSRVEALMVGTPVIATNRGETRGMAVFEPGDVDSLAEHLGKALEGKTAIDNEFEGIFRDEAEENLRRILEIADKA